MLVVVLVFAFSTVALAGPGQGAEVDEEGIHLPDAAKENFPENVPFYDGENPLEVPGIKRK